MAHLGTPTVVRLALHRRLWTVLVVALVAAGLGGCKVVPPPTSAAPIRAAFYYPWFPQAWAQQGQNPFTNYSPTWGSTPTTWRR